MSGLRNSERKLRDSRKGDKAMDYKAIYIKLGSCFATIDELVKDEVQHLNTQELSAHRARQLIFLHENLDTWLKSV